MFTTIFLGITLSQPIAALLVNGSCSLDEFLCPDKRCIPNIWRCDGDKDCLDGSDELSCRVTKCSESQFECAPQSCIPNRWVCDGTPDCPNGLDETQCSKSCRVDQFTCNSTNWCIDKIWTCDGENDCDDGSDEMNCPKSKCSPSEFKCTDNHCINFLWRCDGDYDCPDYSDEEGCSKETRSLCHENEYQCRGKVTCIPLSWVCDGKGDCPDGDDESGENCTKIECRNDQFKCQSNICIDGNLYCNGDFDCPDKSDEVNCTALITNVCKEGEFHCGSNMCISNYRVCDNIIDCFNGKDEASDKCNQNECLINNGGCSQICKDTATAYYCSCEQGYHLVSNYTCEDINECENPGACSHICINEIGTYKCECFEGYLKDYYDRTRCKPIEGHTYLLFTRKQDIRKLSIDRQEMSLIVNDTKSATGLDFIFRTGMIFWSDISEQKIYKAPIDGVHTHTVVISNEVTMCDGLAVDWIYNHIYWTDTGKNTIEVANLDGTMRKTLLNDELDEPRAIVVNPLDGWMYWSDWGREGRIEKGGLDGSHRHTIVEFDILWPNGLSLDLVRKRLYWIDAKLNKISSANYDGSGRTTILQSSYSLSHPFSISVFEDFVYWTDWDKKTIFRANKFNGSNVTALTSGRQFQSLMVVHAYHPYRQPEGINYCLLGNNCSHLCLPAPHLNENSSKFSCACPEGLILSNDQLQCTKPTTLPTSYQADVNYLPRVVEARTSLRIQDPYNGTAIPTVIISVLLFLIFTSTVAYLVYRNYLRKNITSTNFDNPVYRKTTEDRFSLEKVYTPHHAQQDLSENVQKSSRGPRKIDIVQV